MSQITEISPTKIASLPREEVIDALLHFPATFKFDFTREYLESLTTDQLRHLLMAACLHKAKR